MLVPAPVTDELMVTDGLTEVTTDHVPRYDAEVPVANYRDWDPTATRIIACAIANDVYPGPKYPNRDAARRDIETKHGRILEANYVPGRAFFRVKR
jgi:hypothetical protein